MSVTHSCRVAFIPLWWMLNCLMQPFYIYYLYIIFANSICTPAVWNIYMVRWTGQQKPIPCHFHHNLTCGLAMWSDPTAKHNRNRKNGFVISTKIAGKWIYTNTFARLMRVPANRKPFIHVMLFFFFRIWNTQRCTHLLFFFFFVSALPVKHFFLSAGWGFGKGWQPREALYDENWAE